MKRKSFYNIVSYFLCIAAVFSIFILPTAAVETNGNVVGTTQTSNSENVIGNVYFNKPIQWANGNDNYTPSIYAYCTVNGESIVLTNEFPGTPMTPINGSGNDIKSADGKVYSFAFTAEMFEKSNIDINNTDINSLDIKLSFCRPDYSSAKTSEIDFCGFDKLYNISYGFLNAQNTGKWYDFDPSTLHTGCVKNTSGYKNIIFMIGDGMGENHIKAGEIFKGEQLNIQKIKNSTYVKTNSTSDVTDSAAAATALATGIKTTNSFLGQDPSQNVAENITETARKQKMLTGLVVTCILPHATPAGFSAHINNRNEYGRIAELQTMSNIDVMFGGGTRYFYGIGTLMQKENYSYVYDFSSLEDIPTENKVIGTFADEKIPVDFAGAPTLAQMTQEALKRLENDNGFFLMVEGSDIDTYSHSGDLGSMLKEMIRFDDAVATAMQYVDEHPDTLLIVTADHETGGLTINNTSTPTLSDIFFTSGGQHTASFVKVLIYGDENENLTSADLIDNTDIYEYVLQGMTNYSNSNNRANPTNLERRSTKIKLQSEYYYDTDDFIPQFDVYYNSGAEPVYLKENTDYTLTCVADTEKRTATVTVKGIGDYCGTVTQVYEIKCSHKNGFTSETTAEPTCTSEGITTFTCGICGYSYTEPIDKLQHKKSGWITDKEATAYEEGSKHIECTVCKTILEEATIPKVYTPISNCTISNLNNKQFTGSKISQNITLKDGSYTLKNSTDYTITYKNNINVGTATVTITGKGNYTGTKTATFKILPISTSKLTVSGIANKTYTGKTITQSVTVKNGTTPLKNGTDYTVSYKNNTKIGTATVIITGKGNYTGTKTANFKIVAPKVAKPINLKATQTTNSVKLSWSKVNSATSYGVYRYDAKTKTYKGIATVTGTSYTDKKLKSGTTYKYIIRAKNTVGGLTFLSDKAYITTATKPDKVKSLKASTNKNSVKLSWSKVNGATSYGVYRYDVKTKTYKGIATVTGTSYTDKKLKSGTTYKYLIRAKKAVGSTTLLSDKTYTAAKTKK